MAKTKKNCLDMIAEEVKNIRTKYEPTLTQKALGNKIGKTKQAISDIESSRYFPSVETLYEIGNATKTNLSIRFLTDRQLEAENKLKEKKKQVLQKKLEDAEKELDNL